MSARCFIVDDPIDCQEPTFTITDTKPYVPVVTLSTQVMQNYCNNWNKVLKEQLTGININEK